MMNSSSIVFRLLNFIFFKELKDTGDSILTEYTIDNPKKSSVIKLKPN